MDIKRRRVPVVDGHTVDVAAYTVEKLATFTLFLCKNLFTSLMYTDQKVTLSAPVAMTKVTVAQFREYILAHNTRSTAVKKLKNGGC